MWLGAFIFSLPTYIIYLLLRPKLNDEKRNKLIILMEALFIYFTWYVILMVAAY